MLWPRSMRAQLWAASPPPSKCQKPASAVTARAWELQARLRADQRQQVCRFAPSGNSLSLPPDLVDGHVLINAAAPERGRRESSNDRHQCEQDEEERAQRKPPLP